MSVPPRASRVAWHGTFDLHVDLAHGKRHSSCSALKSEKSKDMREGLPLTTKPT
jgi:hypothetical protein